MKNCTVINTRMNEIKVLVYSSKILTSCQRDMGLLGIPRSIEFKKIAPPKMPETLYLRSASIKNIPTGFESNHL